MSFQFKTNPMPSLLERRLQLGHSPSRKVLAEKDDASQQNNINKSNHLSDGLRLLEQYMATQMPSPAPSAQRGSPLGAHTKNVPKMTSNATEQNMWRLQSSSSLGSSEDDLHEKVEKLANRAPNAAKSGRLNRQGPKKTRGQTSPVEIKQKRERALERNRIAASKCRKRKAQQLDSLQEREIILQAINTGLKSDKARVSEELNSLKSLLMTHKTCSIAESSNTGCQNTILELGQSKLSDVQLLHAETSLPSPDLQQAAASFDLPETRSLDRAMQLLRFSIYDNKCYSTAQRFNESKMNSPPVDSSIDRISPTWRSEGINGRVDFLDPCLLLAENSM